MGIELESETRIVIGRLTAPRDPEQAWWWQSSTTVEGVNVTVTGFAGTENDAILDAAASTIDLRGLVGRARVAEAPRRRPPEPDFWGVNGDDAPERAAEPERSIGG